MREAAPRDRVPDVAKQNVQFELDAWWWAGNKIGRDLRELYGVPKELPTKLLALVSKLDAVDSNQSPRSRTLLKKLDAFEGKCLSRSTPPAEPRSICPDDDEWSLCT